MPPSDPIPSAGHPLVQLIAARVKEFWREPAAVFWVYAFPLIMMLEGAGLASLTTEIAVIAAWGAVTFALALRWFRWSA